MANHAADKYDGQQHHDFQKHHREENAQTETHNQQDQGRCKSIAMVRLFIFKRKDECQQIEDQWQDPHQWDRSNIPAQFIGD